MKEKKHTSIDNQLEKLKGRNITIDQHEEKEIKKILVCFARLSYTILQRKSTHLCA